MGNTPSSEKSADKTQSQGPPSGKDSSSDSSSRSSGRLGRVQNQKQPQTNALTKPRANLMIAMSQAGSSGISPKKQITETVTEVKSSRTRLNFGEVSNELTSKTTRFNGLNLQGGRVKSRLEVTSVSSSSTTLKRGHPAASAVPSKKAKTSPVVTKAKITPVTKAKTSPVTKAKTGPVTKAKTSSAVTKAKTGPVTKAKISPVTKAKTGPVTKAKISPVIKGKTGPVTKPATSSVNKAKSTAADITTKEKPKPVPNSVFYGTKKLDTVPMSRRKVEVVKSSSLPAKKLVTSKKTPVAKLQTRSTKSASSPKVTSPKLEDKTSPKGLKLPEKKRGRLSKTSSPGPKQQQGVKPKTQAAVSGAKASGKQGRPITKVKARVVTKSAKTKTPKRPTKVIKLTKVVSKRKPEKTIKITNVKAKHSKKDTLKKPIKVNAKVVLVRQQIKITKMKPNNNKVKVKIVPKRSTKVNKTKVAIKRKATKIIKIKHKKLITPKFIKKKSPIKPTKLTKSTKTVAPEKVHNKVAAKPVEKKPVKTIIERKNLTVQKIAPKKITNIASQDKPVKIIQRPVATITKQPPPITATKTRSHIITPPAKVMKVKPSGVSKIRLRGQPNMVPRVINVKPQALPETIDVIEVPFKVSPVKQAAFKKVFARKFIKILPKSSVTTAARESRSSAPKTFAPDNIINITKVLARRVAKLRSPGKPVKVNKQSKITKVKVQSNKIILATMKVSEQPSLRNKVKPQEIKKIVEMESKKPEIKEPKTLQGKLAQSRSSGVVKVVQSPAKVSSQGKPVKVTKVESTDRSTRASKIQLRLSTTKVKTQSKRTKVVSKRKSPGRRTKLGKVSKLVPSRIMLKATRNIILSKPQEISKSVGRPGRVTSVVKPLQKKDTTKVLNSPSTPKLVQISLAKSRGAIIPQSAPKTASNKVTAITRGSLSKVKNTSLAPSSPAKVLKSSRVLRVPVKEVSKSPKIQTKVSAVTKTKGRPAKVNNKMLNNIPQGELIKAISANLQNIVGKPAKMINDNFAKVLNKNLGNQEPTPVRVSFIKPQASSSKSKVVSRIHSTSTSLQKAKPGISQDSVKIVTKITKLRGRQGTSAAIVTDIAVTPSKTQSPAKITTTKEKPVTKKQVAKPKIKPQKKSSNDTKFGLKIKPRRRPMTPPKITKRSPIKTTKITKAKGRLPVPAVQPYKKPEVSPEFSKPKGKLTSPRTKVISSTQSRQGTVTKGTTQKLPGKAFEHTKAPTKSPTPRKITIKSTPGKQKVQTGKLLSKPTTPTKEVGKATDKSSTVSTPKSHGKSRINRVGTAQFHPKTMTREVTKTSSTLSAKGTTVLTPKLRGRPSSSKITTAKVKASILSKVTKTTTKSPTLPKIAKTPKLRGRPPSKATTVKLHSKTATSSKVTKTPAKSPTLPKIAKVLTPKLSGRSPSKPTMVKLHLKTATSSKVTKSPMKQPTKITSQTSSPKPRGRPKKAVNVKSSSSPAELKRQKVPVSSTQTVVSAKPRGRPKKLKKVMSSPSLASKASKVQIKTTSPKKDIRVQPASTLNRGAVKRSGAPLKLPHFTSSPKKVMLQSQPASESKPRGRPPKIKKSVILSPSKITKSQIQISVTNKVPSHLKLKRGRPASLTKSVIKFVHSSNSVPNIVKLSANNKLNNKIGDSPKLASTQTRGRPKGTTKIDNNVNTTNTIFRAINLNSRLTRNGPNLINEMAEKLAVLVANSQVKRNTPRNGPFKLALISKLKSGKGLVSNLKQQDKFSKLKRRSVSFSPKVQCQEFYSSDDESAPRDRRGKRVRCVPFSIPLDSGVVTQYLAWQSGMVDSGLPVRLPRGSKSPVKPARNVKRTLDLGTSNTPPRTGKPGPVVIKLRMSPKSAARKAGSKQGVGTRKPQTSVKVLTKLQTSPSKPSTSSVTKPTSAKPQTGSAAKPKVASKPQRFTDFVGARVSPRSRTRSPGGRSTPVKKSSSTSKRSKSK